MKISTMNILLINHYAGSDKMGMEFRPYYLAKEWYKIGHKATIIAASYSHIRRIQPKKAGWENIDNIQYLWLWTNKYLNNGIRRFINMLVFVSQLLVLSVYLSIKIKPHVVIASSTYPLDIFPAWIIAKISRAKLVFEIHDLWPLSPMELGRMSKWHPFIMVMRFGEWFAYKFSDKIISILPYTFEHVALGGVKKEDFTHIPNGINVEDFKSTAPLAEDIQTLINNQKKREYLLIGYAGSIGIANALGNLVSAAKLLQKEKTVFFILGDGPMLEALRRECIDLNLKNILFLGKAEKLTIHSFLTQMDALYIGANKSKLYRVGVSPNKLFDYMMAAKPVIEAIGAKGSIVEKAKCGFIVEPDNPKKLAETIIKIKNTSKSTLQNMGKQGHSFVLKNHAYDYLAKKFVKAIK